MLTPADTILPGSIVLENLAVRRSWAYFLPSTHVCDGDVSIDQFATMPYHSLTLREDEEGMKSLEYNLSVR
jgi:hypothetical protein